MKKNTPNLTPVDALTEALVLSITARNEEFCAKAAMLADDLVMAFRISPAHVELAKTRALRRCNHDCSRN